jgi:predicted PurR-regulated permease PerM
MTDPAQNTSPAWSPTTKLVVGLTFVAIVAALVVRFNNIIGPLILVFILSYLLHPLVSQVSSATRFSWRASVNLIYLAFLVIIVGFLTVAGFAIVQQLQSLVRLVQNFVTGLPELAENLAAQGYTIQIPVTNQTLDISEFVEQFNIDFLALSEQALSVLQPVLGQAGGLLGQVAASTLVALAWGAFILIISYFILAEAGQVPDLLRGVDLPGFDADLRRLGRELGRIWNAFLRGQLVLFVMIVITSFLLLSALGLRNALGLAFLAGLAKFIPYIGPLIAGLTTALVAFFQPSNYLDMEPFVFAVVVVVAAILLDQIFDNLVTPRIFGQALGVHPAGVLISAIIAANLIGFVGLLLAAPVLASFQLFLRYASRKMVDLDPFPEEEQGEVDIAIPFERPLRAARNKLLQLTRRGKNDGE